LEEKALSNEAFTEPIENGSTLASIFVCFMPGFTPRPDVPQEKQSAAAAQNKKHCFMYLAIIGIGYHKSCKNYKFLMLRRN
jgi:hypothetical protein